MALSTNAKIGIGLGLGVGALLAAGASSSTTKVPAYIAQIPKPIPLPPTQGGSQPDPAAPDDPDRGRLFVFYGAVLNNGVKSPHESVLLRVADVASGHVIVDMWEVIRGHEEQCAAQQFRINFAGGKLTSWKASVGENGTMPVCPMGSVPLLKGVPLVRSIKFVQKGNDVILRWEAVGKKFVAEDSAPWFSPEETSAVGIDVDAMWRFYA